MDNIQLSLPTVSEINVVSLFINLAFCIIASLILRSIYIRKSLSLSGKYHIGTVIPMLTVVTFLVIMVVKSSLALSLGLVGALSVIRFRTPIKEPEELVYLFMAIALGLGYGAGQTVITSIVFVVVMFMIIIWLSRKNVILENEYNVLISWSDSALAASSIIDGIRPYVRAIELRKLADNEHEKSLYLKVDAESIEDVENLMKSTKALGQDMSCIVHEARALQ